MKIAVDARYLGHGETGRLLEAILANFNYVDNMIVLIGKKDYIERYPGAYYVYDETKPNDLNRMFKISRSTVNMCDAFFTPSFIIPKGIRCKIVSIVPNLMWLDHKEINKGKFDSFKKKLIIRRCLTKSSRVFTMSKWNKERIKEHFGQKLSNRVIVRKPGANPRVLEMFNNSEKKGYVIFTGNYKYLSGIETVLKAMSKLTGLELLILGSRDKFKHDRPDLVEYLDYPNISFTEKISNTELLRDIQMAKFLVVPSVYAGYSMSIIEALNLGTKALVSDIEPFKEEFKDEPVDFFKVSDCDDLVQKLITADPTFVLPKEFNEEFSSKEFSDLIFRALKN